MNALRRRRPDVGQQALRALLAELVRIKPAMTVWLRGFLFASLNWTADIACLLFACHAIGVAGLTPTVVLVSYAAGMAGASLPLIAGGLGVVDGALIIGLSHGGRTVEAATAALVLYRPISLVLVVTVGWLIWWRQRRTERPRTVPDVDLTVKSVLGESGNVWQSVVAKRSRFRCFPSVGVHPSGAPRADHGREDGVRLRIVLR